MSAKQHSSVFSRRQVGVALYAALVVFLAYASIFAYRKAFTAASFNGLKYWGVSYQTLLIISQVIGYMLSKFYGIKFIAELKRMGRWKTTVILTGIAWFAMFLFGITPAPYGMIFLFINGFVLGFLWGVIFSYVEGRRATDFIGLALAVSFIFAGGFSRSVGKWLMMEWGVSEEWMPFMTGLVFALPLALFIFLMERIPLPDADDINERTVRQPMTGKDRKYFIKKFGLGIVFITITYLFLTVIRDIRDNYMANIWTELGYGKNYSIFTKTETRTSLIILLLMSSIVMIRKNIKAFRLVHIIILTGFLLAGISSWLFINHKITGAWWMQLVSLGLYMGYIPFNSIFFERLIATFKITGNVGFLIYIADSFGYLGSVSVMLTKEFLNLKLSWSQFYSQGVVWVSVLGVIGTVLSLIYFNKKYLADKRAKS